MKDFCRECNKEIDTSIYPLCYGICETCIENFVPPPMSEAQKEMLKVAPEWERKCDKLNLNNTDKDYFYALNMSPDYQFHIFRIKRNGNEKPIIFNKELSKTFKY